MIYLPEEFKKIFKYDLDNVNHIIGENISSYYMFWSFGFNVEVTTGMIFRDIEEDISQNNFSLFDKSEVISYNVYTEMAQVNLASGEPEIGWVTNVEATMFFCSAPELKSYLKNKAFL